MYNRKLSGKIVGKILGKTKRKEFDPYGIEDEEFEWKKQNQREKKSIDEEYY